MLCTTRQDWGAGHKSKITDTRHGWDCSQATAQVHKTYGDFARESIPRNINFLPRNGCRARLILVASCCGYEDNRLIDNPRDSGAGLARNRRGYGHTAAAAAALESFDCFHTSLAWKLLQRLGSSVPRLPSSFNAADAFRPKICMPEPEDNLQAACRCFESSCSLVNISPYFTAALQSPNSRCPSSFTNHQRPQAHYDLRP
jgi:hypothetical protein